MDRGEVDDYGDDLSPRRVCRHTCSSNPTVVTPSNRPGSLISARCPRPGRRPSRSTRTRRGLRGFGPR
jgi:hypothetical protein